MEKYILNDTPVRTANNFGINNIELNLDIPTIKEFENITIESEEIDKIILENKIEELPSRIGLNIEPNYGLILTIPENVKISKPVRITFDFDEDNTTLVDNIKIILEKNSYANFIIKYDSEYCQNDDCVKHSNCEKNNNENEETKCFHYLRQNIVAKENSKSTITIANLINNESDSFIEISNNLLGNSKVTHNLIEFGGNNKISNYYTKLAGKYSENDIKNIYIGKNDETIDMNYNIEAYGEKTKCNFELQGAITDNCKKNFKGVIDFKKGCKKSKGIENENCMILSPNAKSKSLPVLLCHEEDVEGEHGVASGKLDENKLFYIMTKGISYKDAKKLIVKANFSEIIRKIQDEKLQQEIMTIIDNI